MPRLFFPLEHTAYAWRRPISTSTPHRASSRWPISVGLSWRREPTEKYKPGGYHPVRVGEVYNEKYKVVRKLGWGQFSTVWLVQNLWDNTYGAMKMLVGELGTKDALGTSDELDMMRTVRDTDPHARGRFHICHLLDDFICEGPHGKHICLVLDPMGFSTLDIYCGFQAGMPLFLVKRICKHVLLALQYMHDECAIVHTDIKADNILMNGLPPVVGEKKEMAHGELSRLIFKLTDFGAAHKLSRLRTNIIQPEKLRAPEVIIGAGWDTKADIWNLGCLLYEFAAGTVLFQPYCSNRETAMDPTEMHLAQMEGLFGRFPRHLVERGKYAGHFFDNDCRLLRGSRMFRSRLVDLLDGLGYTQEELNSTIDFLSRALIIDPEQRWSATQLLGHPWLRDVD